MPVTFFASKHIAIDRMALFLFKSLFLTNLRQVGDNEHTQDTDPDF